MAMTCPGALRAPTAVLLLLSARLGAPAVADEGAAQLGDLMIEQLMNVEIVSISKKREPWSDDHHLEFGRPDRVTPTEMERSTYGKLTLRP